MATHAAANKAVLNPALSLMVECILTIGETTYDAARSAIPCVLLSSSPPVSWPALAWCGCKWLSRRIWMPSRKNLEQVSGQVFFKF